MLEDIKNLKSQIESDSKSVDSPEKLDEFKHKYMVKKGAIQGLLVKMKDVPKEEKPLVGKEVNILKKFVDEKFT